MIELLHIDCMEYMANCKDKQFDLAIVDPPYGIEQFAHLANSKNKATKRGNYGKPEWDIKIPNQLYFDELKRISKEQIVWGNNYFGLKGGAIVWDKNGSWFSDGEIAYCSLITGVRFFRYTWNGMLQENMKDKEERIHPTQKPVQLYKWLLKNYAKPDMKIIDTHLGSGSSAIAAYDFGCDFAGCEIDKEYYEGACKRFNTHKLQQTINFK